MLIITFLGCGLMDGPQGRTADQIIADEANRQNGGQGGAAAGGSHTEGAAASGGSQAVGRDGTTGDGSGQSTQNAVVVGKDDAGNKGVRVGGEHGVVAGDNNEVDGVRVGGKYGVIAGSAEDNNTKGVRVGGENGVVMDGRKGLKIGGKTLIGKKK